MHSTRVSEIPLSQPHHTTESLLNVKRAYVFNNQTKIYSCKLFEHFVKQLEEDEAEAQRYIPYDLSRLKKDESS